MEFPLTIIRVFLITVAALFYAGFGLTRLLSFERIRTENLLIAPFVGLSLLISVAYWSGWMGWSAGVALGAVLFISTVFNLLAFFRRKGTPQVVRGHLFPFALASLVFAVAVSPMGRSGRLGPVGVNGDQVLYTNVTAYLEQNGLPVPLPSLSKPATVQLSFINWGLPIGFNYLHAFVDTLSGREAHETFSLVTALSLALAVPTYAFLARCLFGLGSKGVFIVTLLLSVSPTLMWVHYNDYGMHVMSLGLTPLAFGLAVLSLGEGNRQALLFSALLLSAALTSYPLATVPFAILPLVIYALLLPLRKTQRLTFTLGRLSVLSVLAMLLNLPGVFHVGKFILWMFRFIQTKEFGDVDEFVPWAEVYGLSHHILPELPFPIPFFPGLVGLLTLAALLLTLYGVWRARGDGRLIFLSLAIAYIPFILWLRFALSYPYGFFKAITFLTFPAIIGLALGAEGLFKAGLRQRATAAATWVFVALLLTVDLAHLIALSKRVATTALDLHPLLELRNVKGVIREGDTIHVRDAVGTDLLWITYFLKDHNLTLAHYSPYYLWRDWPFYQQAIRADLVLIDKGASVSEAWAAETVYENHRYKILRKDSRILVHLDFVEEARLLKKGQELKIRVLPDKVFVDGKPFPLGYPLEGWRGSLRLGTFVARCSGIKISSSDRQESIRFTEDLVRIDYPITELPGEIILLPEDERGVLISGWLELLDSRKADTGGVAQEGIFDRFRQEVLPGSEFFVVSGWHALEGWGRWTKDVALAVFRNPFRPASLRITGSLPDRPGGVNARFVLNGRLVGEIKGPGAFSKTYLVDQDLLGSSPWGELEVSVDRTFNPKALKRSSDPRDLGIGITELALVALGRPGTNTRERKERC